MAMLRAPFWGGAASVAIRMGWAASFALPARAWGRKLSGA
jgi:hypothetical protein